MQVAQLHHRCPLKCVWKIFKWDSWMMDWWTGASGITDGRRSLLCAWSRDHSSICQLCLSGQYLCCCLGDQADIWGFWPGERLRHLDGGRRRARGGPEDHFPCVSASFFDLHLSCHEFFPVFIFALWDTSHFCSARCLSTLFVLSSLHLCSVL